MATITLDLSAIKLADLTRLRDDIVAEIADRVRNTPGLTEEEAQMRPIDAIRAIRYRLGWSLRDAKAFYDTHKGRVATTPAALIDMCADCGASTACVFGRPGGMATNGGCRCYGRGDDSADRLLIRRMAAALCDAAVKLGRVETVLGWLADGELDAGAMRRLGEDSDEAIALAETVSTAVEALGKIVRGTP